VSMSWQATEWAWSKAPMPKPDPTARSVLAYLGARADRAGRHSHPKLLVLAHDLDLHPETVRSALTRLVGYGLIVEDGQGPESQPQWSLDLTKRRPADSYREFERVHKRLAAVKKDRYRRKTKTVDVHRAERGTSTAQDGGQTEVSTAQTGGRPQRSTVLSTAQDGSDYIENGPQERSLERSVTNAPADAPAPAADSARTRRDPSRDLNAGRDDVERLCRHLADRVEANGSRRPVITKRWRDEARLMLDRDGRTEQQAHAAIDWCQDDPFWRANVLSMPKLRERYDQLRLQAQRPSPRDRPSTTDTRTAAVQALKTQFRDHPTNQQPTNQPQLPAGGDDH
jgi:helix-turn-helix protein